VNCDSIWAESATWLTHLPSGLIRRLSNSGINNSAFQRFAAAPIFEKGWRKIQMGRKVLVIDKHEETYGRLASQLRDWKHDVCFAMDKTEVQKLAHTYEPEIIIINVEDPEQLDVQLLNSLSAGHPECYVILISAEANCELAIQGVKHGAFTLLPKPLQYPQLRNVLLSIGSELQPSPGSELGHKKQITGLIGTSSLMLEVHSLIRRISETDIPVLITGESGTGKELAANSIHAQSLRSAGPLIVMNAAAIPSELMESELFGHEKGSFTGAEGLHLGCFESANHGTLFLDEIVDMPIGLQAKLLRVLQDKRVRRLGGSQELVLNVRVIAATNRDADNAVSAGELRGDLYHRLNVFGLNLPALRNRKDDLKMLIDHFLAQFNVRYQTHILGLKDDAMAKIQAYSWPGNVRELRNVLERAVVLESGNWIRMAHLPKEVLQ
jgi:DNA-binding NtrC family response regulator